MNDLSCHAAKPSPEDPAPLWLSKATYFFRVGLTLFLALSCLLSLWGCSSPESMAWQPATRFFDEPQVRNLLVENSTLAQPTDAQVKQVRGIEIEGAIAIDFNQPELCGNRGCLYGVYDRTAKPLLQTYLRPELPPGVSLIAAAGQAANGHSCLHIHQVESATTLKQFLLCDERGQYRVINQVEVVQNKT